MNQLTRKIIKYTGQQFGEFIILGEGEPQVSSELKYYRMLRLKCVDPDCSHDSKAGHILERDASKFFCRMKKEKNFHPRCPERRVKDKKIIRQRERRAEARALDAAWNFVLYKPWNGPARLL